MKIRILYADSDTVVLSYRVYHRRDTTFKSYIARICGPHPQYYLDRKYDYRQHTSNPRFDTFRYSLQNGIYEFVVKRFDSEGHLLSKERNWLIVCNGCLYQYESDDMNYQYVLYVAFLLQQKPLPAAS